MTDIDNARTIVNTALQAAGPATLEVGKVHAFHTATGVHKVDLTGPEYTGILPRKVGDTTVRDVASFLSYFGKHSDTGSEVYADVERLTVTAVLDAHQADTPRWNGHTVALKLRTTEAWRQWLALDGKLQSQEAFAEFLEDHLPELVDPDAATMLEIAQSFQAASKVDFQSGTRLATGERQFKYVETVNAKAGQRGELTIPETFRIGLVPFEGSPGYKLTARLRYRIVDTQLRIGYKLERPADILTSAFNDVVGEVGAAIEQPVMNGTPA